MENKHVAFEQLLIKLISINQSVSFQCQKNCFMRKDCELRKLLNLSSEENIFYFIEVISEVLNPTNEVLSLWRHYWQLVDSNAYIHYPFEEKASCYYLGQLDIEIQNKEKLQIPPQTRVKTLVRFLPLQGDTDISSIIIHHSDNVAQIILAPLDDEIAQEINITQNNNQQEQLENETKTNIEQQLYRFNYTFNNLEHACHSRITNILTPNEITKLENKINDYIFSLHQLLRDIPDEKAQSLKCNLQNILDNYNNKREEIILETKEKALLDAKIDDLYNLNDFEFEEWTADLFRQLGFEAKTTPKSGDKGIDVICKKNNKLVVVQCKKYKGVVGSPDIQKFLGAIQNANADEGYFVTTGTFSIGAEKAATGTKIILCDKFKIKELVELALKKDE